MTAGEFAAGLEDMAVVSMAGPMATELAAGPGTSIDRHRSTSVVAHHEAAHAVIGLVFGRLPHSVTIVPDENAAGRVRWVADEEAGGQIQPNDETKVQTCVEVLKTHGDNGAARRIERRTAQLLAGNWIQICRVADALLERGTLSGAEVAKVVNGR